MTPTLFGRTLLLLESISLSVLLLGCVVVCDSPKSVSLNLRAKWRETSLLLETSEFVALESRDKFWQFVDRVAAVTAAAAEGEEREEEDFFPAVLDRRRYDKMLEIAALLLTPLQLRYLKFALVLRTFSPKVAMLQQLRRPSNRSDGGCETFAVVDGVEACDAETLTNLVASAEAKELATTVFDFDHVHPSSDPSAIPVVLYGFMGSRSFRPFHETLSRLAREKRVNYVLRHSVTPPSVLLDEDAEASVRLSGFGVELAIKSTEYKAQDDTKVKAQWSASGSGGGELEEDELNGFRFTTLSKQHPELIDKLFEFRKHLVDSANEMAPLKVWEVQDLSLQTAQRILESPPEGALKLLLELSQNFPRLARSLSKIPVKKDVKKEIRKNQAFWETTLGIEPGESALFLSGIKVDLAELDIFSLLETLKSETTVIEGLHSLGFRGPAVGKLAALELKAGEEPYALDIRDPAVVFLNDLEEDSRYRSWPSNVQDLLRPAFPGTLRHVRKNFHHVVFFVDPTGRDAVTRGLIKHAEAFLAHDTPFRIGFVLVVDEVEEVDGAENSGVAAFRLFNYFAETYDATRALSFLSDLAALPDEKLTPERVAKFYHGRAPEEVFGVSSKFDKGRRSSAGFYRRTGLGALPIVVHNGVAFQPAELETESFEDALVYSVLKQTNSFQLQVYNGEITNEVNLLEHIMSKDNVVPRLNPRILEPEDIKSVFLSLSPKPSASLDWPRLFPDIQYLYKSDPSELLHPPILTHLLVADFDTPEGLALLSVASKHMKKASSRSRIGLVHYSDHPESPPGPLSLSLQIALRDSSHNGGKLFFNKLLRDESLRAFLTGPDEVPPEVVTVHGVDLARVKREASNPQPEVIRAIVDQRALARDSLNLGVHGAAAAVVSNGRVLRVASTTPDRGVDVVVDDIVLVEKVLLGGMEKIKSELVKLDMKSATMPEIGSDLYMQLASLMFPNVQTGKRHQVKVQSSAMSSVLIKPMASTADELPALDVVVLLDPVSREAQKLAPLLLALREVVPMDIKIYMNCKEKHSELPLKSFYQYSIDSEPRFDPVSGAPAPRTTVFKDVPKDVLFTMTMDLPEQWLVGAVRSPYDLDNIKLATVDEGGVHAEYELENILLEGHCHDSGSGQPPRGLQFVLRDINFDAESPESAADVGAVDTIVMANLGYFQLKANPGAWVLNLREGPSRDVYSIGSHEGTERLASRSKDDVVVVLDSFKTKVIKVKVAKKAGKENVDILGGDEDDEEGFSLWNTLSDTLGARKKSVQDKDDDDDTINVFSLATGHLYERLMRIMMLSVLKNTQSPVKFWILKNFMSPDFKKFLPVMAKEYGFKYELVEYKWPRWLHRQTEKQRVIWGYKILFLDVLFPLSVKKIIFVDADQIVRADLKELKDLDLGGAPYGYTPFCDDRKEMDGFRFWKSGYWASHLGHRKYHISALYVVDLQKFRRVAAGDRLRGQYQGLSQDPNSLANLDQDLPNNMIHQVGIKSLPQEWLWCETWCSDESKAAAKTIDLCNNPLTKEPKLTAAARIAPEWTEYDREIKELKARFDGTDAAADADAADATEEEKTEEKRKEKVKTDAPHIHDDL